MNRKLASIQRIATINPIEGADKIQVATMENLGWECVVRKDEVKVGDLVVYFECDSILPETPWSEFLRERKFRIKIIKLKKQVSMGLILPISILPPNVKCTQDMDVTEILKVTKHDPQLQEEQTLSVSKHASPVLKFFMKNAAFRTVYMKLNSKEKGNWPAWISKTDEERIQSCAKLIMNNFDKAWYINEKLDGQSGTFFTHYKKVWGFNKLEFGVCSRNIWLKTPDNSNYWKIAKKFDLEKKLKQLKREIVIQGEILASNVQSNKYKVVDPEFYVFTIVENGKRVALERMEELCQQLQLQTVPILRRSFIPNLEITQTEASEVVREIIKMSEFESKLSNIPREGCVWRLCDNPTISFKAINPSFLLKYD